jgi:hypothetical protein
LLTENFEAFVNAAISTGNIANTNNSNLGPTQNSDQIQRGNQSSSQGDQSGHEL